MLTYAADFWPLFWTIIGSGMVLTVLLSVLVATFSPTWFQSHRLTRPLHVTASRRGHEAEQLSKAA
jgi:hypothetical protein